MKTGRGKVRSTKPLLKVSTRKKVPKVRKISCLPPRNEINVYFLNFTLRRFAPHCQLTT